jgi:hypothetical protein
MFPRPILEEAMLAIMTRMYTQRELGRRPEFGRVRHFIERTAVMHRMWDFKLHLPHYCTSADL